MNMRALLLSQKMRLATCLALAASGHCACADEAQDDPRQWHSYQNQMTVDEYNQSFRKNRQHMRTYFKSAAKNAFSTVGIPDRAVGYMGAAIGLATRDSRFNLNESKSLSLELMDLAQDNRGIFLGYRTNW